MVFQKPTIYYGQSANKKKLKRSTHPRGSKLSYAAAPRYMQHLTSVKKCVKRWWKIGTIDELPARDQTQHTFIEQDWAILRLFCWDPFNTMVCSITTATTANMNISGNVTQRFCGSMTCNIEVVTRIGIPQPVTTRATSLQSTTVRTDT